jgi:hypothetical protein
METVEDVASSAHTSQHRHAGKKKTPTKISSSASPALLDEKSDGGVGTIKVDEDDGDDYFGGDADLSDGSSHDDGYPSTAEKRRKSKKGGKKASKKSGQAGAAPSPPLVAAPDGDRGGQLPSSSSPTHVAKSGAKNDEQLQSLLKRIFRDPLETNRDTMLISYPAYLSADELANLWLSEFDATLEEYEATPIEERRPTKLTVPQRLVRFIDSWVTRYPPVDLSAEAANRIIAAIQRDPLTPEEIVTRVRTISSAVVSSSARGAAANLAAGAGGSSSAPAAMRISSSQLPTPASSSSNPALLAASIGSAASDIAARAASLVHRDDIPASSFWRRPPAELLPLVGQLARALSLIAWTLYSRLQVIEFVELRWQSAPLSCPNVGAVVLRFQSLSYLVPSVVLQGSTVSDSAQYVEFFIALAVELLAIRDFDSAYALYCGLSMVSVVRLRTVWKRVAPTSTARLDSLGKQLGHRQNARAYRALLDDNEGKPLVPQFNLFLRDLIVLYEGNPCFYTSGLVNFDRLLLLSDLVQRFLRHRRWSYPMEGTSVDIVEQCLSLPSIQDDDRLYSLSLRLEPSLAPARSSLAASSEMLDDQSQSDRRSVSGSALGASSTSLSTASPDGDLLKPARRCVKAFWGHMSLSLDADTIFRSHGTRFAVVPRDVLMGPSTIAAVAQSNRWPATLAETVLRDIGHFFGWSRARALAAHERFAELPFADRVLALLIDAEALGMGPLPVVLSASSLQPEQSSLRVAIELGAAPSPYLEGYLCGVLSSVAASPALSVTKIPLAASCLPHSISSNSLTVLQSPSSTSPRSLATANFCGFLLVVADRAFSRVSATEAASAVGVGSMDGMTESPEPFRRDTDSALRLRWRALKGACQARGSKWPLDDAGKPTSDTEIAVLRAIFGTSKPPAKLRRETTGHWGRDTSPLLLVPLTAVFGPSLAALRQWVLSEGQMREEADQYFVSLWSCFGELFGLGLARLIRDRAAPALLENLALPGEVLRACGLGSARASATVPLGGPPKKQKLEIVLQHSAEADAHIDYLKQSRCWDSPDAKRGISFCSCLFYFGAYAALLNSLLESPVLVMEVECRAVHHGRCFAVCGHTEVLKPLYGGKGDGSSSTASSSTRGAAFGVGVVVERPMANLIFKK